MKKKFIVLFFIVLIVIYSLCCYGGIVSDNDGSAFVTKAEFDALKNDFADQVINYNLSIDNKIDGAIAQYLAGIKLEKKQKGTNYTESISDIRFYNLNKDFQTCNIDTDIRYQWLVRAFGSLGTQSVYNVYQNLETFGSWLYNSDGTHERAGNFNYKGNETNYFYEVENIILNGTEYKALSKNKSYSVRASIGGFASGYGQDKKWGNDYLNWKTYDLDLSSFDTNNLAPWSYSWSQAGMTASADGIKFNVWNKNENTTDIYNNYLYLNNSPLMADTDINTFTESDFTQFGNTIYNFTSAQSPAHDFWTTVHTTSGYNVADWSDRRAYCWYSGGPQRTWFPESYITIEYTHAVIKHKRPNFKTIKSGKLINGEASKSLGKPVYPYNGVPITTINSGMNAIEANVKVVTKRVSDDVIVTSKPYYVVVSNKPFDNVSTIDLINAGDTPNIRIFHIADGASDYKLELGNEVVENWEKNDDVFLKVYVEDSNCYASVKVSDLIVTTE